MFEVAVEQIASVFTQQDTEVFVDAFVQLCFVQFFDREVDKGKQVAAQHDNCFLQILLTHDEK